MTEVKTKPVPGKFIKPVKQTASDLLDLGVWFILSLAATGTFLFGRIAPFGVAAVAASKRGSAVAATAGAVIGYAFSRNPGNTLRYIAAVLMVFGAKLVFEKFAEGDIVPVLTAAFATAFASFGYAAATVITGYNGVLALSETVLAAGAAYFFRRTGKAFEHGRPVMSLSGSDRACLIMTGAIAASALSEIAIGKLSLGGIFASAIVLFASKYGGESGGAVAGTATGLAVSLAGTPLGNAVAGYAAGGLVSGIFSPLGKIMCAGVFVAVRLLFCLVGGGEYPDYAPFYESLIASGVFMLVPEKAVKNVFFFVLGDEKSAGSATVKELVLSKMGRAADGLFDIAAATKKVAGALQRDNTRGMSTVLDFSAERNCRMCSKSSHCWQEKYSETAKAFHEMGIAAKTGKEPDSAEDFIKNCLRGEQIFNDIKMKYRETAKENSAELKVKRIREVVTDQFDGMALLLKDIAAEAASVKSVDKKLSKSVKNVFEGLGITLYACTCYYNSDGCLYIEVSAAKERFRDLDLVSVTEELSDICGCDLSKPIKRDTENARRLVFFEKPLASALFGKASINAEGEKYCGDSGEFFLDGFGCAHMILSDGMGSGEHAALDSMMASGLVARMVRAGFRFGPAIKLVNSALLLKSEDESLATVDAFSINLYTGAANFYKAGAEASFVIKSGRASKVENSSYPVGILGGAEFEQSSMHLDEGDVVALVSDGATATGSDWIPSELRALSEKSAQEIAEGLAKTAKKRRNDGHSDDITVMVMKIVSGY